MGDPGGPKNSLSKSCTLSRISVPLVCGSLIPCTCGFEKNALRLPPDTGIVRYIRDHLHRRGVTHIPPAVAIPVGCGREAYLFIFPNQSESKDIKEGNLNLNLTVEDTRDCVRRVVNMLPDVRLGVRMLGKEAVNHVYRGHRLPISRSNELIGLDSLFGQRKISFMTQIVSPLLPRIHALSQIVLAQEDMKAFFAIPAQSIAHVRTVNVINEVYFFKTPYRSLLVRTRPTVQQQSQKPASACVEMWTNWGPSQSQSAVCLRVFNDRHLLNVNLNLGNLSIITIVDYPMEWHHVFVHICLPCAPRLVEVTLSIRFPRIAGIQSKENIRHAPKFKRRACFSVLRKLALRLYEPSQNPKFLEYIDAPVLDSFVVNASEMYMPLQRWDIQTYAKFLRKAWATLTALELVETLSPGEMFMGRILDESEAHGMRLDGADLDTLFSAIPKVLHLKLPFTIPIHKDVFWRLGRRDYISRMTDMRITCPSRDVPAMCRALKMRESYFRGSYFEPKSNKGSRGDLAPEVVCTVFLLTSYPEDDEGWSENGVEKDASGDQNEDRRVIWRQHLEAQIAEILRGTGVRMSVAYLPYGRSSRNAWVPLLYNQMQMLKVHHVS